MELPTSGTPSYCARISPVRPDGEGRQVVVDRDVPGTSSAPGANEAPALDGEKPTRAPRGLLTGIVIGLTLWMAFALACVAIF